MSERARDLGIGVFAMSGLLFLAAVVAVVLPSAAHTGVLAVVAFFLYFGSTRVWIAVGGCLLLIFVVTLGALSFAHFARYG